MGRGFGRNERQFEVLVPLSRVKHSLVAQVEVWAGERGLGVVGLSEMSQVKGGDEVPHMPQLPTAMPQTTPKMYDLFKASHSV